MVLHLARCKFAGFAGKSIDAKLLHYVHDHGVEWMRSLGCLSVFVVADQLPFPFRVRLAA